MFPVTMTKHRQRYLLLVCSTVFLLAFLHYGHKVRSSGGLKPIDLSHPYSRVDSKLVFPASFPEKENINHLLKRSRAFRANGYKYSKITQKNKNIVPQPWPVRFTGWPSIKLFGSKRINLDLNKCDELLVYNSTIAVSRSQNLNSPLERIIARIIREIDRGYDQYLQELKPYIDVQIRLQLQFGVVDKHWFNMAGSSVYLEDYGYHMMVSRLAYSPDRSRNNPKLSLAYVQLFDENWKEVEDVSLVVPTNVLEGKSVFKADGKNYAIVNYPSVLPIPFFHDYEDPEMKYLGPEDARLILVKNKAGHDEPLLVYNSQHQKQSIIDDDEDKFLLRQMILYRSMWVSWPWQFQRGKYAVEDYPNDVFDKKIYNRVKELEIRNTPRQKNQKNWTPFVSDSLRSEEGYDKHLFFVYRWAHLQILRCDFTTKRGKCGFMYTLEDRLKISSDVGPLRGGTPLINLNSLIKNGPKELSSLIDLQGREIWAGFARAHLVKCGCGNDFYRPNLVILVKDAVSSDSGHSTNDVFHLSHISSFTSLDVDIISWNPADPLELCKGTNALIPNGISDWKISRGMSNNNNWKVDDMLSLAISVSDCTIDVVHIRGLMEILMNLPDHSLFPPPSGMLEGSQKWSVSSSDDVRSNDNIACAMEASSKFCFNYGKTVEYFRMLNEMEDFDYNMAGYDARLVAYHDALYEAGYLE